MDILIYGKLRAWWALFLRRKISLRLEKAVGHCHLGLRALAFTICQVLYYSLGGFFLMTFPSHPLVGWHATAAAADEGRKIRQFLTSIRKAISYTQTQ